MRRPRGGGEAARRRHLGPRWLGRAVPPLGSCRLEPAPLGPAPAGHDAAAAPGRHAACRHARPPPPASSRRWSAAPPPWRRHAQACRAAGERREGPRVAWGRAPWRGVGESGNDVVKEKREAALPVPLRLRLRPSRVSARAAPRATSARRTNDFRRFSPNCERERNASIRGEDGPHPWPLPRASRRCRGRPTRPSKHREGTGHAGHHPPCGAGTRRHGAGRPGPAMARTGRHPAHRGRRAAAPRRKPAPRCAIIRPARFVEPDEVVFRANAQRFQDRFNIPVRVDFVGWEDIRPQTAVVANTGTGPDIVIGWSDDPHIYADKVVELNDVADYLGKRYGGWGSLAEKYGQEARQRQLDRHPRRRQYRPLLLAHLRGEGGRVRQHAGRPRGVPQALPGDEEEQQAGRLRARQRGGRRQRLRAMAAVVAWRLPGGRGRQGRDQQPADGRGAEIPAGALPGLRAGHALLARSLQQPGLFGAGNLPDVRTASRCTSR